MDAKEIALQLTLKAMEAGLLSDKNGEMLSHKEAEQNMNVVFNAYKATLSWIKQM